VRLIKDQLASDLVDQIRKMDPHAFESLVLDVLAAMGYGGGSRQAMQGVPRGPDGGIDGWINEDKLGLAWLRSICRPSDIRRIQSQARKYRHSSAQ
jgi:restriction system protein